MNDLTQLTPNKLWQWFADICRIPHGSHHEEALATYIIQWANNKGFATHQDSAGNIFITKPATCGMEHHQPIALQAHLDMVCQANDDYDFLTQPIIPVIDGDWVRASGTTLGADNGIGLASILAVLDSDDLSHPMLEAVLTMTEETGMDGAFGLERGRLKSRLMINTDTEQIDEIYIGCAGGVDGEISLPVQQEPIHHLSFISITIAGLKGGHSGLDIDKNHSNAIKLLAYVLSDLECQLVHFEGGTARNAIPRQAYAIIAHPTPQIVMDVVNERKQTLQALIGGFETNFSLTCKLIESNATQALSSKDTKHVIDFINTMPNGVLRQSDAVSDTVETSLSLGVARLNGNQMQLVTLIRSLNENGKHMACSALSSLCALANASIDFQGSYVGWQPNPATPITQLTFDVYKQVIGKEAALKVIHAGLECGLIQQAYPDMDIVSIGPTIKNAHSPDECVHIGSVDTYWQVLTKVLQYAPK